MADILTESQLKGLKAHKYSAQGVSLVEPYMQVFWRWLVEQLPLWWAPNAITLVGLIINISSTSLLVYYSPDAAQNTPRWACFLTGLGLFVYQALDAVDGKQARRTNSASPLGELFDHGCDSVSTVFVVVGCSISAKVGTFPEVFLYLCLSYMFFFYAAHWQTYCTGTLKFGTLDVTEGQLTIILIHLISAVFGTSFWDTPIFGIELKLFPVTLCAVSGLMATIMYLKIILFEGGAGKHGSTVAGTSIISPIIPIAMLLIMCHYIHKWSVMGIYVNHPVLFVFAWGSVSAKITCKLVLAHMSCSEMDLVDSGMLGPLILLLNQYMDCPFSEYFLLWVAFLFCWFDLLVYAIRVCRAICDYLDIFCFSIVKVKEMKSEGHRKTSLTHGKSPSSPHRRK